MAEAFFLVKQYAQPFKIDPTEITANGDKTNPYLNIPIRLTLKPINNKRPDMVCYFLTNIEANIICNGFRHKTSEILKVCNIEVTDETQETVTLLFPLDPARINLIESSRKENLNIVLNIRFHYGICVPIISQSSSKEYIIGSYGSDYKHINFEIPQSNWVKTILPGLGFQSFRLIELPEYSNLIPEEYKLSLGELAEAEKYYRNGDYDKVVSHCRAALDPFKGKMKEMREYIKSKSEFEWIDSSATATYTWLSALYFDSINFASKTHHPPSMGHFDRSDAESIYLVTVGILSYIGKLKLNIS